MAQMTVQYILDSGVDPTKSAANSSDQADVGNGHNTFLDVVNAGGTSITVTIQAYGVADNGDVQAPHVVTVAATTGKAKIPLRKSYDKGDGTGAQITYSAVTSVTTSLVRHL